MQLNAPEKPPIKPPVIAAHRGANRHYPENSLAAIKEAVNIAMEHPDVHFYIEMDLRRTMDGGLVLMHDSDVSRTTKGRGHVETMLADQVTSLKMKPLATILSKAAPCPITIEHPTYPITEDDLRPAALHEVMVLVEEANRKRQENNNPIGLAIEIKAPEQSNSLAARGMRSFFGGIASTLSLVGLTDGANVVAPTARASDALAQALNARAGKLPPMVVFSSRGQTGKRDLKQLFDELNEPAKAHLTSNGATIQTPRVLVDKQSGRFGGTMVREAIEHTRRFWAMATADVTPMVTNAAPRNDRQSIEDAIYNGANFITTDYPDEAIATLKSMQERADHQPSNHSFVGEEMARREDVGNLKEEHHLSP